MQEDLGSKIKTSLIWNTSLKAGYQIFRFFISIIIARILDPKDFGIMGLATMVVFYANSITTFGFNAALVQRKEINEKHINSVFSMNLMISLLLMVCTILFSSHIAAFFKVPELKNVLLVLSLVFVLTTFFQLPICLMKREVNFKTVAFADLSRGLFQTFVTLSLAILGFKYWALVIGLISSYLFGIIYLMLKVGWKGKLRYNHRAMKEVFNFGIWNFLRAQTFHINEYADKFIIGKFLGPVLLGFYEKAFSTVALQKNSFTMQVNAVMFSSFSRLQSEKSDKNKKYLKKTLSVISLATFPLNMGFFTLGTYFVIVLLGNKWEPMVTPLRIISLAFLFSNMTGLFASFNIGTGNYVKQTLREVCCNILMILFCLLAVQRGIEFVALVILLVYALMFSLTFQLAKEKIGMGWSDLFQTILPASVGSVIMALVVLFCKRSFFDDVNLVNFIILVGTGATTYLLAVFVPPYSVLEEFRGPVILRVKKIFSKSLEA